MYLRDLDLSPKEGEAKEIKIRMLFTNLQVLDQRWNPIPVTEVIATQPRTLVNAMNTHLNRFKKLNPRVKEVINKLPLVRDQTEEQL